MNETGWSKDQQKRKVISRKGQYHQRPNMKQAMTIDHITSVHAVAADGTQLTTMVIFKVDEPVFQPGDIPTDMVIRHSDSGFINTELFLDWLQNIVIPFCSSRSRSGPFLLTMDNAAPHISLQAALICIQYSIHIFCLLPNASGWLQPLDQIFSLLKNETYTISRNLSLSVGGFITNKKKFPYILSLSQ